MKPVLYLDVDDTILIFPQDRDREWWKVFPRGAPAPYVKEFLEWARANFEVRWLTMWAMRGWMHDELVEQLAGLLHVPVELVQGCDNPLEHNGFKPNGVNWAEHAAGRRWFWVEDGIPPAEQAVLSQHNALHHFISCHTSRNPDALRLAKERIEDLLLAEAA